MLQPQEIEVWYLLPAIRREIAKELVKEHKFKQKDVAKVMSITTAAVSQYLHNKRGKDIDFPSEVVAMMKEATNAIANDMSSQKVFVFEVQKVLRLIENNGFICQIHRKYDEVPTQCLGCYQRA